MKYVDEFRNLKLAQKLTQRLKTIIPHRGIRIMEVCGTHTQSFYRFGIDKLLPGNLQLISGPGCPVCVSSQGYIDNAIMLAKNKNNIIVSFGDMLRVPGNISTLEKERAAGANVSMVYSPLDALRLAQKYPQKKVIFLAVGFETTAPTIAVSILLAKKEKINNLSFLTSLKLIPPAIEYLLADPHLKIDAFLCPGHVSAIIGIRQYEFIPKKYKKGCCVAGFEPVDILEGLYLLVRQIVNKTPTVDNQYMRVVTKQGNTKAQKILREVFKNSNASWRGLGDIPGSGLKIKDKFIKFDAEKIFNMGHKSQVTSHKSKCRCGDVLKGLIRPNQCPLFKRTCTPQDAFGPCMVSVEGACNVYYKYHA